MNKSFSKIPISKKEQDDKANKFLNFDENTSAPSKVQKEATCALLVRMPISFKQDLYQISTLTGLSLNAICLDLLRPAIRKKLKDINE